MKNIIKIGNRKIGEKFKPFIICELGINHNFSYKFLKEINRLTSEKIIEDVQKKINE